MLVSPSGQSTKGFTNVWSLGDKFFQKHPVVYNFDPFENKVAVKNPEKKLSFLIETR